jgi:hypothetical protein
VAADKLSIDHAGHVLKDEGLYFKRMEIEVQGVRPFLNLHGLLRDERKLEGIAALEADPAVGVGVEEYSDRL